MSKFRNVDSGVVISIDDSKDERYTSNEAWESADKPASKPAAKKADTKRSTDES